MLEKSVNVLMIISGLEDDQSSKKIWVTKEEFLKFIEESDNNLKIEGIDVTKITAPLIASGPLKNTNVHLMNIFQGDITINAYQYSNGLGDHEILIDNGQRHELLKKIIEQYKIAFTYISKDDYSL